MNVDLGNADAAVGISVQVISEYLAELQRIGQLPDEQEFDREVNGQTFRVRVLLDAPVYSIATDPSQPPRAILQLTGSIEARPLDDLSADPLAFPLEAAVLLTPVLVAGDLPPDIGFRYDGVDGTPSFPVEAADIDAIMTSPDVQSVLDAVRLPLAANLVAGLNESRFPLVGDRPADAAWDVRLTLTPAADAQQADSFVLSVAPPGSTAELQITESFLPANIGLAVAYNRAFLDLMLARAAAIRIGQKVEGAVVKELEMMMADDGISVVGHVVRPVDTPGIDLLPDVDIDFEGVAIPQLVRGTVAMSMDTSGIEVDVDDSDEIFYGALQWVITIGASALLFTGVGSLTALGIGLWLTAVQAAWNGAADIEGAPGALRESLGASLGAQLSRLAESLDDSTPAGDLTVDGSPDAAIVVDGNIVLTAQVFVQPVDARMRSAEYASGLRRFGIFQLTGRRRFRAQELARLMAAGKVSVSGFHHVNGDHVRSNHDDSAANNLLQSFSDNETTEIVVGNV